MACRRGINLGSRTGGNVGITRGFFDAARTAHIVFQLLGAPMCAP
jgi:hypothetical protein